MFGRLLAHAWIVVLIVCLSFTGWAAAWRAKRVDYVTNLAREAPLKDASFSSGYSAGVRDRIVPEHFLESFDWIRETQHALTTGDWRVRHVQSENAPFGRVSHTSSLYRLWLAACAKTIQLTTDVPSGVAVERAANAAEPALLMLLLLCSTVAVARWFSSGVAAAHAVAFTALYPLAANYQPAILNRYGLVAALLVGTQLPLIKGLTATAAGQRLRGVFICSGIFGGLALGTHAPVAFAVIAGTLLGLWVVPFAALRNRLDASGFFALGDGLRWWSLSGATVCLATFLAEYAPQLLADWALSQVHPVYALSWLGGAELARRLFRFGLPDARWIPPTLSVAGQWLFIVLLVAALPVALWWTKNVPSFAFDLASPRLTMLPDGISAPDFGAWLARDGGSGPLLATTLPLLAAWLGAALLFSSKRTGPIARASLVVATIPVLVATAFSWFYLRWWTVLDATLVPLLIVITWTALRASALLRYGWWAAVAIVSLIGVAQLLPHRRMQDLVLTAAEAETLIERDLATWLAARSAGTSVPRILAPPASTTSLSFYGGFDGVGTFSPENTDGLAAAVRIISASSFDEAHALISNRGITHLILPSWDPFFDRYTEERKESAGVWFLTDLKRWSLPSWLRPIPYQIPKIGGLDSHYVFIFEVVEEQEEAVAASRLAEYFVEMGQVPLATRSAQQLTRYPGDLSALIARAQVARASQNLAELSTVLESIQNRLSRGGDRLLPVDRRVSLAVVLAREGKLEASKAQLQRCLATLQAPTLRSLSTASLYHLHVLAKAFELQITDPALRELALSLLPRELRQQL